MRAAFSRPYAGDMPDRRYQLYVKLAGHWQWCWELQAVSHEEAFRKALLWITKEFPDKPVRLEQDDTREPQE